MLAQTRRQCLAVDISKLDRGTRGEQAGFQMPRNQRRWWKKQLRKLVASQDRMTEMEEERVRDIFALDTTQKWRLYRLWTHKLAQAMKARMAEKEEQYAAMTRDYREAGMQEDEHIFRRSTVIAMTTTGAARYQDVLQRVKPRVIVVEEAAEVLEGHVITTLNQNCQHLILIGDHKQLRPNPTVYRLARKYNLELSLFERMIDNGLECNTLGWQHRMRPEIAELVQPIYPELHNHPSVERYEPVKGVSTNVFFINHGEPEQGDSETKSHSNAYEARYMAQLCLYLLKQGYEPSRITVLTAYSGQLLQLRKLMPKDSAFEGVRVTVVDNFQGEENDIILLSLVRSNQDGKIGFLKTENRVCVALSRAKMGLYVIGNFDQLSAGSDLWLTITTKLKDRGLLGEQLKLYCQNHPEDQGLVITTPDDFKEAPEGGCKKPCTARLDCGHVCTRLCHPNDKEHKRFLCKKPCEREMPCKYHHPCPRKCHEECGDCMQRVQEVLPRCGHQQWMVCSQDLWSFICQEECQKRLACGHKCGKKCGESHQCMETVELTRICGHLGKALCRDKKLEGSCHAPCGQLLACGHTCSAMCYDCQGGRLHLPCQSKCTKTLVCGHKWSGVCSTSSPCDKPCKNKCAHRSCPKKCGKTCVPCMKPCAWKCPHHRCTKKCIEPCDRVRCNEPCQKTLAKCGHACIGLCGEPCPKLCRVCDVNEVKKLCGPETDVSTARFVQLENCRHVLEVSVLDEWMLKATPTDATKDSSVQLKTCPRCETPIRCHPRYGPVIKSTLEDIEFIKSQTLEKFKERKKCLDELGKDVVTTKSPTFRLMKEEVLRKGDKETLAGLGAMKTQMNLLEEMRNIRETTSKEGIQRFCFYDAMTKMEDWVLLPRLVFTQQEVADAKQELMRLRDWMALMTAAPRKRVCSGNYEVKVSLSQAVQQMKEGGRYTESQQDSVKAILMKCNAALPPPADMDKLLSLTVKPSIGHSGGQWLKCSNGHVYMVTDDACGAAAVPGCPECK